MKPTDVQLEDIVEIIKIFDDVSGKPFERFSYATPEEVYESIRAKIDGKNASHDIEEGWRTASNWGQVKLKFYIWRGYLDAQIFPNSVNSLHDKEVDKADKILKDRVYAYLDKVEALRKPK